MSAIAFFLGHFSQSLIEFKSMDVFLSCGCAGLSHIFDLCLAFEIFDKRPGGGSDGVVDTLDRLIERLFQVLIGLRRSHEGDDCRSVLVQGRH